MKTSNFNYAIRVLEDEILSLKEESNICDDIDIFENSDRIEETNKAVTLLKNVNRFFVKDNSVLLDNSVFINSPPIETPSN